MEKKLLLVFDPTKKKRLMTNLQDEASQQIGEGLSRPEPGNLSQMIGYILSGQLKKDKCR